MALSHVMASRVIMGIDTVMSSRIIMGTDTCYGHQGSSWALMHVGDLRIRLSTGPWEIQGLRPHS
eukprot:1392800-Amorphochlora_amoeboformis.AAC.2